MRCSSASDNVRERERDGVGTSVSCAVGMLKISLCRKKREIFLESKEFRNYTEIQREVYECS